MASVELRNIHKTYGSVEAVNDVSLQVADKELMVIVGPSGCGKSTLLRMIAGLEVISGGQLSIGDKPMNDVAAADRGIAMVFQSYALYPHMNVAENMGFALRMLGMPQTEVEARVAAAAQILQLEPLLGRRPQQLSGGQQQRVAIGRAITRNPDVFLFDEPLSNLDADLRAQMRVEIARLHEQLGTTMIYVTHDQVEAMTLADRIVILNNGRIEQLGTPIALYEEPANRFVAGFLGQPKMNFMSVEAVAAENGGFDLRPAPPGSPRIATVARTGLGPGAAIEIGVRPNAISVVEQHGIPATVELVERLGGSSLVHARIAGIPALVIAELPGNSQLAAGARVGLNIAPGSVHVFGETGKMLYRC